jgi:1,4-alpha-glucan branching enzyme
MWVMTSPEGGVLFHLEAPTARKVLLVADFTAWDKTPIKMLKGKEGVWQARVELSQGRHRYKFLVDGEWKSDPSAPEHVPNAFGTLDSVMVVPA